MRPIARQPIFDGSMQLCGDGLEAVAPIRDFDLATRPIVDTTVMMAFRKPVQVGSSIMEAGFRSGRVCPEFLVH